MHEIGLLKDLLAECERIVLQNDARRVSSLRVWLGAFSHLTEDHFREHFERESVGTAAEGAELQVEVSEDETDPKAQGVLLKSVEVEV